MKILKPNSPFIPTGIDKEDFIHFPSVAWENVWKSKNAARTQNIVEHWDDIFRRINGSARAYSYASFNRKKILRGKFNDKWELPPAGWLKFNVDAAVRGSKFWSAAVQRDNYGKINGAWVNFDVFVSVFMLNYVLPFLFFRQEMVSNLKTLFWRVMLLELLTPLLETKPIQIGDPRLLLILVFLCLLNGPAGLSNLFLELVILWFTIYLNGLLVIVFLATYPYPLSLILLYYRMKVLFL